MAILVEHLVIAFKVVMALVIPDVPAKIREAEFRRQSVEASSHKEMVDFKLKHGYETFDDINNRLQREATRINYEELLKEEKELGD